MFEVFILVVLACMLGLMAAAMGELKSLKEAMAKQDVINDGLVDYLGRQLEDQQDLTIKARALKHLTYLIDKEDCD
jgi:hypothetical protein